MCVNSQHTTLSLCSTDQSFDIVPVNTDYYPLLLILFIAEIWSGPNPRLREGEKYNNNGRESSDSRSKYNKNHDADDDKSSGKMYFSVCVWFHDVSYHMRYG